MGRLGTGCRRAVGSGYDVAFYNASTGLFNIWSTDSNGNYITNLASGITGTSSTLENFETIFDQDLNGDGTIGPPSTTPTAPTVIEAHGVTSLLQSGSDYFLNPVSSGTTITGPELMFNGAPVTVGMWAGWAPVAAEHVGSGYDVAFYNASTGLFNIWSTDSNGNYITNLASGIAGTSSTLENFETIFDQDLNGDGTIGPPPPPPPTMIEAHGVTTLLQSGNDYFLNPVSSGTTITGPELIFNGAPVTVGMWAGWAPVAAEHVGSGYDVAFYNASTGLFNIWSTDSNGNYIANLASGITGSSTTLENFETIFDQDLNGDGTIGPPAGGGSVTAKLQSAAGSSPDNFRLSNHDFHFSNNESGTTGQTPASSASQGIATAMGGHDSFVFAPDHGPTGTARSTSWANTTPSSNSAVAHSHDAGTHEDAFGASIIPDAAHLLAHHSGFHFV